MPELRVTLFGVPRCLHHETEILIPRRKAWALLAYLLVTGQAHSRDALAAMFYPDYDTSTALSNLRRTLFELKSALGGSYLSSDRLKAGLDPSQEIACDVLEFQERIERVKKQAGSGPCPDCLEDLQAAAALYSGDFLAGFSLPDSPAFDEWQFFQSDGLRQDLAGALQRLVQAHRSEGAHAAALPYARRWLALDPLHEPAQRLLMELYAASGQTAAALRQYGEAARLLKEELGVEPEPETTALFRAIRQREYSLPATGRSVPALDPAPVEVLPGIAPGSQEAVRPVEPPGGAPAHNLPAAATPFVGREAELARLEDLLLHDPNCRLVTVLGPGGAGKTRLALQAAWSSQPAFSGGTFFIPLASLTSAAQVPGAVAEQLGFHFHSPSKGEQELIDYLRPLELLLVLDNVEHLLPAQDLPAKILHAAPKVKLLATSRSRLNLKEETVLALNGLEYPPAGEDGAGAEVAGYEAVRLLVQSARRVRPGFELDPGEHQAAARICRLVDGMPLAIELAAGWLEMLSLEEVAEEVARSLDFLESQASNLPSRQRSLRAVFDSSWSRLEPGEQAVLLRLAVFQGRFTRQAAQAVAGAGLPEMQGLAHKSWLQRHPGGRYGIHELLRQFTLEQLRSDSGAWQAARDAHSLYFAGLLEAQAAAMRSPQHAAAFSAVAEEFDNAGLAWDWLVDRRRWEDLAGRLLPALFLYAEARGRANDFLLLVENAIQSLEKAGPFEGSDRLGAIFRIAKASFSRNQEPFRLLNFDVLTLPDDDALHAALELSGGPERLSRLGFWGPQLAFLYGRTNDYWAGRAMLERLVEDFRRLDRRWERAFALELLGCTNIVIALFDFEKRPYQESAGLALSEALQLFRQLGDEREAAYTLRWLGDVHSQQRGWTEAVAHWKAAQARFTAMGDWALANNIDRNLGDLYLARGDFPAAFRAYQSVVDVFLRMGHKRQAAYLLSKLSYEALRYSSVEHALETRRHGLALNREIGDVFGEAWSAWEMGEVQRVGGHAIEARQWYEQARHLFESFQEPNGMIFYHRGLGDLALTAGDFPGAHKEFFASLELARKAGFKWGSAYVLSGLGSAAFQAGQLADARRFLTEALSLAATTGDSGLAARVLLAAAGFFAASGQPERAAGVCSQILSQHLTWYETRQAAGKLLQELQPGGMALGVPAPGGPSPAPIWPLVAQLIEEGL